jgi:hypothetical protein
MNFVDSHCDGGFAKFVDMELYERSANCIKTYLKT